MAEDKPTDKANFSFKQARLEAAKSGSTYDKDSLHRVHLTNSLAYLAEGLQQLSVGLRATYLEVEEVKTQQQQILTRLANQ